MCRSHCKCCCCFARVWPQSDRLFARSFHRPRTPRYAARWYRLRSPNAKIGIVKGASTTGGAILVSHTFKHGFSLPVRWEYIASSGSAAEQSVNLMFGPGSAGTSITVTPTFQYGGFFFRGDLSWVHASDYAPAAVFGATGMNNNQPRAVAENGFMFGNNVVEKK